MTRKRVAIILSGVLGVVAATLVLAGLPHGLDGPTPAGVGAAPLASPTPPPQADLEKLDLYVKPFYCGDSDMDGDEATGAGILPGTGTCCDGADNDGNTLTDGQDPKCTPHINEDAVGDANHDGYSGVQGVDDDGDTQVDEGPPEDDDEDGWVDEDPWTYGLGQTCPWNGDDDCDGVVDEDPKNDSDDDGYTRVDEDPANGFLGIDNDRDGLVDEDGGGSFDWDGDTIVDLVQLEGADDDGDTQTDEDPLDSPVERTVTEPAVKWEQAPDTAPTGLDVNSSAPFVLADDFSCTETGLITQIEIWGSWLYDYTPYGNPGAVSFTLSIHSDVPAGVDLPWSHPGDLLWIHTYAPGECVATLEASDLDEGWMDPPGSWEPFADSKVYRYTCPGPLEFTQQGTPEEPTTYWLDVKATTTDPQAAFGWKTSLSHWNDDAVWDSNPEPVNPLWWEELRYPGGHPMAGQSIDLAFRLVGQQELPVIHEPHYLVKETLVNNGPEGPVWAWDGTGLNAPAWKADAREDGRITCNDGLDNETPPDGLIDAADPDCLTVHVWEEDVGLHSCNDGLDNGGGDGADELDSNCQTSSEVSLECTMEGADVLGAARYVKPPSNDPILLTIPECVQYYDPLHFNKCVPCKIPVALPNWVMCSQFPSWNPGAPGYCIAVDSAPTGTEMISQDRVALPVGMPVPVQFQADLACGPNTSLHSFHINNFLDPEGVSDPNLDNNSKDMDVLVACLAFTDGELANLQIDGEPFPITWDVQVSTNYIKPVSVDVYNNGNATTLFGVWLNEVSPGLGILNRDEDGDYAPNPGGICPTGQPGCDEDGAPWNVDDDYDYAPNPGGACPTGASGCDEDPAGLPDTDGDGWADNVETTLWSAQNNAASTPENLNAWVSPHTCYDGVDNDLNGLIDAADPKCWDSDEDGHSDAAETVLHSNPGDFTSTPEIMQLPWTCGDGLDNDNDGTEDGSGAPPGLGNCDDDVDNDGDTLVDAADPQCSNFIDAAEPDDDGNTFGDCTPQQLGGVRPPLTCASGWIPYDGDGDTRPDGTDGGGILLAGDGRLRVTLTTGLMVAPPPAPAATVTRDLVFHCFAPTPDYPDETIEAQLHVVPRHVLDLNSENNVVSGTFSGEATCEDEADAKILSWDFTPEVPDPFYTSQEHIYTTAKVIHNYGPDPANIRVRKTLNAPANCDGSLEVNYAEYLETVVIPTGVQYNVNLGHETEDWELGPATLTPGDGDVVYVQGLTDPLRQLENEIFAHFILPPGAVPVSVDVVLDEDFDIYCREPGQAGVDDDGDTVVDEDPGDGLDNDGDTLIDEDPPGYAFQFGNEITPVPYPQVCDPTLGDQSKDVTKVVDVVAVADKLVYDMGWDINASDRDTSDPDLDIWTSESRSFTVTSLDANLGPQPTDSNITFLANVPPNCEGRWLAQGGDTLHEYEQYDPANPLDQVHGVAHRDAKVPGDGDPMFPPMRSAESALHFQTWEDSGMAYFYNRDFELHCLTDGAHTFTFCNKAEPVPPTVDPNLGNNWVCKDLTVTSADCSPTVDSDGDTFKDNIECYLPTDQSDKCRDAPGDDAWPLDIDINKVITVVGDVLPYSGRIGATGGPPPSANWRQRLDLNKDNLLTVVGDVLKFSGKIGQTCT